MELYWCETSDHTEDCLIVASSAKETCRIFEDTEDYDRGDAWVLWYFPESKIAVFSGT